MEDLKLPFDFLSAIDGIFEPVERQEFLLSLQQASPTCVRLNPNKLQQLSEELVRERSKHCKDVYILKERPLFVGDPGWHCGAYYVQELNSTRVGETVRWLLEFFSEGCVVLDLCGAPGGKSTHISSVLRPDDLLVANEVIQSRNPILIENLSKWGKGNFIVTRADAADFKKTPKLFSIIAADMPCSGEGMFRKDPKSTSEWTISNVKLCASRQMRIAEDIWNSLEEGGYFIYSTCTYNFQENEENIGKICRELGGELVELPAGITVDGISLEKNTYRFYPHRTMGEGFFLAVIKKTGITDTPKKHKSIDKQKSFPKKPIALPSGLEKNWVLNSNRNGELFVVKRGKWLEKHPDILGNLPNVSCLGIPIGLYTPSIWKISSAFDLLIDQQIDYPEMNLSIHQSIQYYQREFIPIKSERKGIVGLRWNGLRLGTGNAVNNGINNLWPIAWRILQKNIIGKSILKITASF